jgi:hypothetical protein
MSELSVELSQEVTELLPPRCRGCSLGRFTIGQVLSVKADPAPVIRDIEARCGGWQSEDSLLVNTLEADGAAADRAGSAVDDNCPYSLLYKNED